MGMYRRPASAGASLGRDTAKKATVPLRDETGRFAGVRPKTAAERSQVADTTPPQILHAPSARRLCNACCMGCVGVNLTISFKELPLSCKSSMSRGPLLPKMVPNFVKIPRFVGAETCSILNC